MPAPVSVGRSYGEVGFICLTGFAVVVISFATLATISNPDTREVTPYLFAVGGTVLLVAIGIGWRIAHRRRWITDNANGFVYSDYRGNVEIGDREVAGIGIQLRTSSLRGRVVGTSRTAIIVTAVDEGRRYEVRYTFRGGPERDPLGGLFQRLEREVTANASQVLKVGGEVRGEGWVLSKSGLGVEEHGVARQISLDQLAAVEIIDKSACVWLFNQPEPILRVPGGGVNASILVALLRSQMPWAENVTLEEDGLGRLRFRRKHSWLQLASWLPAIGAVVLFVVGLILAFTHGRQQGNDRWIALGCVLSVAALLPLGTWAYYRKHVLEVYANGIRLHTSLSGVQELLYGDVESFTYTAIRNFATSAIGSAYLGNSISLEFNRRGSGRYLKYSFTTTTRDAAIDELRDAVAHRIALRWLAEVKAGRNVGWVSRTVFTPTGLKLQRQHAVVPYAALGDSSFHDGYWYLFSTGGSELLCIQTSAPDFFPGYALLSLLIAGTR